MPYRGLPEKLIRDAGAQPGDVVEVRAAKGSFRGVLMPHHDFSAGDIVTVKLSTGYNAGVRVDADSTLELVQRATKHAAQRTLPTRKPGLPPVSLLGTGGTIASYVDYRTGAVHPATTAEELTFAVPEIFEVADVRPRVVFQVFSEDMTPQHWVQLAKEVAAEFAAGARGVVVPHGTDTLAYTAAALSIMLRDLPGPVVLVGSQRSSDRPSSDAALNLRGAVLAAAQAELGEVVVAMHATASDAALALHRGTRVRKMHTSRRDAFQSVNCAPLGEVRDGRVTIAQHARPPGKGPVRVEAELEEDVALVQAFPGMRPEHLERAAGKGLVIAGSGLGHVPQRLIPTVAKLTKRGTLVAMSSHCLNGRANMRVYSTGRDLLQAGCIDAGDMLPETAYIKLMWALARARSREEAIRLFATGLAGELGERTPLDAFGGA
ncbi:MAG TPA: Glu-tRNA(Gln) amidotransferase subunit GatD [Candidatus Thermoplasmatota archaeon]|jgi:glutamyl-tRNA(Gln) amidotransferase subunit D|nr:Glu-tRNA(Gln) amidotransferase subunit GatD [Candidatus Thermoplasmatota archaeon]